MWLGMSVKRLFVIGKQSILLGESYCDVVFDEEDNNVIAEVRDSSGAGGRAEIDVVIIPTQAPEVEILTPTQNGNQYSNVDFVLRSDFRQ